MLTLTAVVCVILLTTTVLPVAVTLLVASPLSLAIPAVVMSRAGVGHPLAQWVARLLACGLIGAAGVATFGVWYTFVFRVMPMLGL